VLRVVDVLYRLRTRLLLTIESPVAKKGHQALNQMHLAGDSLCFRSTRSVWKSTSSTVQVFLDAIAKHVVKNGYDIGRRVRRTLDRGCERVHEQGRLEWSLLHASQESGFFERAGNRRLLEKWRPAE